MVLTTSLFTGLFAAMLRSLFAMILVAFLIAVVFLVAYLFYGASVVGFVLSILGFNLGLILFAAAHFARSGTRSA